MGSLRFSRMLCSLLYIFPSSLLVSSIRTFCSLSTVVVIVMVAAGFAVFVFEGAWMMIAF